MSPIIGISDKPRIPRLGKIHLGIKVPNASGKGTHPQATEYFVVPAEVAAVVGECPTEIPIMFPLEDENKWLFVFYKNYSNERGLRCRGDGETCYRVIDTDTGEIVGKETTNFISKEGIPCQGRECPYYQHKQCSETMNLQFLMPTVPGLGIWQVDSGSINSILNITGAIELIKGVYGRISGIPLYLALEPQEVINPDDHKKKTVRVLTVKTKGTMIELMAASKRPMLDITMPAPEPEEADEPPEDTCETSFTGDYPLVSKDLAEKVKAGGKLAQAGVSQTQADKDVEELFEDNQGSPAPAQERPRSPEKPAPVMKPEDRAAMQKKVDAADGKPVEEKATVEQLKRMKALTQRYTVLISRVCKERGYDVTSIREKSKVETEKILADLESELKKLGANI